MKLSEQSRSYCIEMTIPQFKKLDRIEFDEIRQALKDLPVERLEYNGHFGAAFFFTVTAHNVFNASEAPRVAEEVMIRLKSILSGGTVEPSSR